jgi:hypothetical protein
MATTVKTGISNTPYSTTGRRLTTPNQISKCHTCVTKVKTRNNVQPTRKSTVRQINGCNLCGSSVCLGDCGSGCDEGCDEGCMH